MASRCKKCGSPIPEMIGDPDHHELCPACRIGKRPERRVVGVPDPDIRITDIDLLSVLEKETIEACCPVCEFSKNVPMKYKGSRVRCPKCSELFLILDRKPLPGPQLSWEFSCQSCGMKRQVPPGFLGKKVRCPRCRNISLVTERGRSASLPTSAPSRAQVSSRIDPKERRQTERVFVQNVDLVMGLLGAFRCRDMSTAGIGFFPGRGDWDFRSGSTINFDLSFRNKPLIRNLSAQVIRTNASMVGCSFSGLSGMQHQLLEKLMHSQRFQMQGDSSSRLN